MKVIRHRSHKVRPADYESVDLGATVEIDTSIDTEYANASIEEIRDDLDALLDDVLDKDVDRALKLGGTMEESHLWDFYQKD